MDSIKPYAYAGIGAVLVGALWMILFPTKRPEAALVTKPKHK
jgi:hypothetical protein